MLAFAFYHFAASMPVPTKQVPLPCADCSGIRMKHILLGGSHNTYTLRQTYIGRPAGRNTVESTGKWFLARGNSQSPEAVVLQLISIKDFAPLYFMRLRDSTIQVLDKHQSKMNQEANYTLKRLNN